MKLKNKKTGEIGYPYFENWKKISCVIVDENAIQIGEYKSLAELNEEWEDYEELKDIWWLDDEGCVNHASGDVDDSFRKNRKIGNYFLSREEAERAVEKLKAWKRLKDSGFKFNGGDDACISYRIDSAKWNDKLVNDFDLLFGGEE